MTNPTNKLTARDVMRDAPVIPVIVLQKVEHAVPLARALVAGGIRMLEVPLHALGNLAEVVRRDAGGHAHRDALGAID